MAPYAIRRAAANDLSAILAVLAENASEPPPQLVPIYATDRHKAMWQRILASPDVTVYLAESDSGEPAGTACLSILPNLTYDCRPTAFY